MFNLKDKKRTRKDNVLITSCLFVPIALGCKNYQQAQKSQQYENSSPLFQYKQTNKIC